MGGEDGKKPDQPVDRAAGFRQRDRKGGAAAAAMDAIPNIAAMAMRSRKACLFFA